MSHVLTLAPGMAVTGPPGLYEVLLVAAFAAHVLLVNVALGCTLIALFSPGTGRAVAGALAKRLPIAVAVAVNLAIPVLLFASVLYGQYLYTAAILSAVPWLSLFMVVMIAYGLLYVFQPRAARPGAGWIAAGAGALLLLASLTLVNVSLLAVRPDLWPGAAAQAGGTALAVGDPTFLPRWLHFVTASLAVGGLALALFSQKAARSDAAAADRLRLGLRWFGGATLAQIPVGLWFLLSLPRPIMERFFGGHPVTTLAFMLGLGLAAAALLNAWRGRVGRAAFFIVAAVGGMAVVREQVRQAYLAPHFTLDALPVATQIGPIVMFLACLAATALAAIWAISLYRRAGQRG
ncbi:hypothetical protein GTA51_06935 [Desulfovibrio aerotolerans]|uniref:Uncharacterized protein n=1 Tax=Solidesulfovibrio aerotolerans TaxID=295255 RepID=A0A7C9N188_9BACT|nr:hypothetical protein [Solidesulfovibrio aerotolerans]MYL82871.1 hypothetical protein [Solidesulfovibrio aerotolerans]